MSELALRPMLNLNFIHPADVRTPPRGMGTRSGVRSGIFCFGPETGLL
jgi:hypothetical protein